MPDLAGRVKSGDLLKKERVMIRVSEPVPAKRPDESVGGKDEKYFEMRAQARSTERKFMATGNGSVTTRRRSPSIRSRTRISASGRLGRKSMDVTRDLRDMGVIARDAAQEAISRMGNNASAYLKQGKDKVKQAGDGFEDYIRESPLKSILIAAGVGLVLGRFWMRR